jgi:hypothetical protein
MLANLTGEPVKEVLLHRRYMDGEELNDGGVWFGGYVQVVS